MVVNIVRTEMCIAYNMTTFCEPERYRRARHAIRRELKVTLGAVHELPDVKLSLLRRGWCLGGRARLCIVHFDTNYRSEQGSPRQQSTLSVFFQLNQFVGGANNVVDVGGKTERDASGDGRVGTGT